MKAFSYERVTTAEAAAQAVAARPGAKFIAGGTNLLDLMKLQIETPVHLVDVNHVGLDQIDDLDDGGLRIGALVRNSDLAADMRVRQRYAVLSRALLAGASGQLRNRATTAGNLLQRTRCYYFYDPSKPCNKRQPGSGCSAIGGFNRNHAVLGTSDQCIATHPSDMAVAMRVLDARVETVSPHGNRRVIPIADFHRLPGDGPHLDTTLQPGEFVTSVRLPPPPTGVQLYRKVRDRASYAFAMVSVAAIVDVRGGLVRHARMAFGGLAHKPWRVSEAEALLADTPAQKPSFQAAADAVLKGARGQGHNDFKIPLTRRVLAGVLAEASAT
jgi:xanthine dehydrogenase YagS FAD-binding subunit